jgi:hypothetical protein
MDVPETLRQLTPAKRIALAVAAAAVVGGAFAAPFIASETHEGTPSVQAWNPGEGNEPYYI